MLYKLKHLEVLILNTFLFIQLRLFSDMQLNRKGYKTDMFIKTILPVH